MTTREKYQQIVSLYESQVNLSFRTSDTILLQQYSTPAPIAYLMGVFCHLNIPKKEVKKDGVQYAYKKGDEVTFIGPGYKIMNAIIDIPSTVNDGIQAWLTNKGLVMENIIVPKVISAKKESIGQGYKAFKPIAHSSKEYKIYFNDGKSHSSFREDREDAIKEAISYRIRIGSIPTTQFETSHYQDKLFFEPTAGNGMLTLAGQPQQFIVNELDPVRLKNLRTQGFMQVLNQDATLPFKGFEKKFDAIITNPPFGSTGQTVYYDNFPINGLEHLCALRALDTMADHGKAAIIIGGNAEYDSHGRIQAGKNRVFFSYLYKHYHVMDIITVDGKKLYSRMGTGFNIRIILIDSRKETPGGFPPLANKELESTSINSIKPITTFDDLYNRIIQII